MTELLNTLTQYFLLIVEYVILIVELIGVSIVVWAITRAVFDLLRHKGSVKLNLAEGIGLALEFKMGGELLRTVVVRDLKELAILGAVILLRAAMAFLVQWEIHCERKQDAKEKAADRPDADTHTEQ